jgi:CHAT domain-containing protein
MSTALPNVHKQKLYQEGTILYDEDGMTHELESTQSVNLNNYQNRKILYVINPSDKHLQDEADGHVGLIVHNMEDLKYHRNKLSKNEYKKMYKMLLNDARNPAKPMTAKNKKRIEQITKKMQLTGGRKTRKARR